MNMVYAIRHTIDTGYASEISTPFHDADATTLEKEMRVCSTRCSTEF